MRFISIALILYGLSLLQNAWSEEILLHIRSHEIRATIANTSTLRKQGLTGIHRLCENCGMIFVFPQPGTYTFWMKDTPLPLSIAFINRQGVIISIQDMHAETLDLHSSDSDALYALEMNKDWFTDMGIKTQEYVEGLQLLSPAKN